jgi:PAS domain S-box-containing protein
MNATPEVEGVHGALARRLWAVYVRPDNVRRVTASLDRPRAAAPANFKELLEAAPDPVIITEAGRILLVNREAEAKFGYSQQELVGAPIEMLLPDRFRDNHIRQRADYERRPRTRPMGVGLELFARHKDGGEFPVEVSLSPADSGGRTLVISIVRDISERKLAQRQLASAEEELLATREAERQRLKQVMDVLPQGLIITDGHGRCVASNAAAARILGLGARAAAGLPAYPLRCFSPRTPEGVPYSRDALPLRRALRKGQTVAGEQLICAKRGGGDIPLLLNAAPLRDAARRITGAVLAFQDISDIRQMQRQKDELLATVNHILDGMTEPVVVIDSEGRLTRVNGAASRLLGKQPRDVLGRQAHDVFRWEDEGGRLLEDDEYAFHQTFQKATPVSGNARYLRRADGARVPVNVSAAPVLDAERGVQVAVEVIRDITRQREAEELKDRIISLVSHELRTPIGHIKGFASSLLEPDVSWDEATQRDFIAEIDREADRLAELVTDLLDMSKIESGKEFLQRDWRQPAAIVEQALKAVERLTSNHVILTDLEADLPPIFADGAQLERVIGNLVENAAKYTDPGTEIQVSVWRGDGRLEACVADRGPGIPAEFRDRVFERFFRIKTGAAPKPGTGLGLPICRGIVEAHGGRLWLEEREWGGACFRFSIPLQPA